MPNPLVIIHGYSDAGSSFELWKQKLADHPLAAEIINICTWVSLSNEITIDDVAEGMDRALQHHGITGEFDAMVHSTGMLVIRAWLTGGEGRRGRLKRLIALAPATFGSPLAPVGRGVIGAMFKGSKNIASPDFMAAGNLILDALEPGSRFTWDLAHKDLLGPAPFYGPDSDTPYVFVFDGTSNYSGLIRSFANKPGTDGTVRWAACSLDTEKFTVDFRRGAIEKFLPTNMAAEGRVNIPFWPVAGVNHGTIASAPPDALVDAVRAALSVDSAEALEDWRANRTAAFRAECERLTDTGQQWQQFFVHAHDQLGAPIRDFHLRVSALDADGNEVGDWDDDDFELYAYSTDKSYRCYHVNLSTMLAFIRQHNVTALRLQVIASSGSAWVDYHGEGSHALNETAHQWDAVIDVPAAAENGPAFFYPFTTTLVEVILQRDALDFGAGEAKIFKFLANS